MDNPDPLMHVDWIRWLQTIATAIQQPLTAGMIPDIPFTKIAMTASPRLLGRTTAGAGAAEQITVSGPLTLAAGALGITGSALTKTDDTNITATLTGTPATALLAAVNIALGWTGTLSAVRGGTGTGSYAVGDVLYADTTTTLAKLADVSAGSYLRSGGVTTAPLWSTVKIPNTATTGDLWYASASNTVIARAIGSSNDVLTVSGGIPTWAAAASVATNVTITDDTTTNASMFPTWVTANTGNLPLKVTSTKLFFNPSTGLLTSTALTAATGLITAGGGILLSGGSFAASRIYKDATSGTVIAGTAGATFDFRLFNNVGNPVMNVAVSTQDVTFPGTLTITSTTTTNGTLSINGQANITTNNVLLTGKDTGGVQRGLIGMNASDQVSIASSGNAVLVGGAVTINSSLSVTGNFAVNTNKFTVTAASGNTLVAGTLSVTGDVAINTNKLTVAAASGNTLIAGTLDVTSTFAVNTNKFSIAPLTGNTQTAGTMLVTGDFAVNTNKFTVTALTGNTVVAGTLGVTGVATFTAQPIMSSLTASQAVFTDGSKGLVSNAITGSGNVVMSASPTLTGTIGAAAMTLSSTLAVTGDFSVNTNKFTVTATSGNTVVAGTLGVTGDVAVNTNKFTVAATTGNTLAAGTLTSTGNFAVASVFTVLAASGNTSANGTLSALGDFAINTNKFTVTAASGNTVVAGTLNITGVTTLGAPIFLKAFTVASLPAGVQGHMAYCTDLTAPTYNATAVGGGAVKRPVFYNGTNWVT